MNRRVRILVIAAVLVALLGPTAAAARQDPAGVLPPVRGLVLDARSERPVVGAAVHLLGGDGGVLRSASTDRSGRFSMVAPAPGVYGLRSERVGYHPAERDSLSVSAGDTLDVELHLTPTPLLWDTIPAAEARRAGPLRAGEALVRGELVDDGTGAPIVLGTLRLLDDEGSSVAAVLSGEGGGFFLVSPRPGTYRIRAERIGYRTAESRELDLVGGDTVGVEFRLAADAVVLAPITVTASARPWVHRSALAGMEGFFRRYDRYSGTGFAEFVTRDSIAPWEDRVPSAGHMLGWTTRAVTRVDPASGEVMLRGGCEPDYYLNGTPVPYTMVEPLSPTTLEAVEVYVRPSIPADLARGSPCGVVAYWSRRSPPDSPDSTSVSPVVKTVGVAAVIVGLVALLLAVIQ